MSAAGCLQPTFAIFASLPQRFNTVAPPPTHLAALPIGTAAIIDGFSNDFLAEKLLELGFVPGETVRVEHRAVFGDPMVVAVAGFRVSLRKSEAEIVIIYPA